MNELGPDARAILDAAREAHDPDPHTRARMRAELLRRVGAGAIVATTVAATASKSGAAPLTALLAKLVAVAAIAAGGAVAVHELSSAPGEQPTVAPPPPVAVTPVAVTPVAVTPVAVAAAPSVVAAPPPGLAVVEEPSPAPVATPATVVAKPKVAAPESTLETEVRALREAHLALREGRANDALTIVESMKGNALGQERAATRVLALCALGRADANTSAEKFLASHSTSPFAPRVRAACAIP